jgi:hypothetical protein
MELKLNADNLLRDYAYFKYIARIHDFYFEKNKNHATKINLVYYVDGEKHTKSYRKEYINSVTCNQFQKDALDRLKLVNANANISIGCVTTDDWVLVFKNKKTAKRSAKKSKRSVKKSVKKSSKKNKKSSKKSMKRK